ncbi:hypothetical protein ACQV2T_04235 [Facklamia sp. P13069]|uniref:hypothetical protein n=1 Tax=Facklamia sp. P13069 TaxID=3421954 RepID=UPI003D173CEB
MKFIKLHCLHDDETLYINPNYICVINNHKGHGVITLINDIYEDSYWEVKETKEEIIQLIKEVG